MSQTPAHLQCNEFHALVGRSYADYSEGHQRMYTGPIELLLGRRWSILEIGFGIGFGLARMVEADIVSHYWGCEPCDDSFDYTEKNISRPNQSILSACGWMETHTLAPKADYAFCIEVIEHVPMDEQTAFLASIVPHVGRNLFLSTPCQSKSKHGVRTSAEWLAVLALAGWQAVAVDSQWTTLYICSPNLP